MKITTLVTCAAIILTSPFSANSATMAPNLLFIVDSSNSMWGQLNGIAKIDTAKTALSRLISDLPLNTRIGLMAYGHRKKSDCSDVQLLTPIASGAAGDVVNNLSALTPKGKTPIATSLEQSAAAFDGLDGPKSVVLISDGIETCNGDPCAAAAQLAATGVDVRVHVVGFDLTAAERAELECIAEKGKGRYFAANSTQGFTAAVTEAIVVAQAEPAKKPEIVVSQTTMPAVTREVLWSEEFDGFDLVKPWTVLNPNPENYVIEEGKLLLLTSVPTSFAKAEAENLIIREEKLPRGNWDITAEFKAEFRTGRDSLNFGLRKDERNYLIAVLFTNGLNPSFDKDKIMLRLTKVTNGVATSFERGIYFDEGGKPGYKKFIDSLANGAAITLSKRGRGYFASLRINSWVNKDGNPIIRQTERLTSLRSPGKLTLGISKYKKKAPGEVLIFIDRIEAVAVEGAE